MPRPIHHWKSFWFGILIVIFLTASWGRSIYFAEMVTFGDRDHTGFLNVGQSDGTFYISGSLRPQPGSPICHHPFIGRPGDIIVGWRDPHGHPRFELPPPAGAEWQATWCSIGISHWLIALLFLLPWIAFLQRRHRLMHGIGHPLIPEPTR